MSQDNRIKVIHKSNEGLSSARNIGLNLATGDYIFFVDSDDFLEKNCIYDFVCQIQDDVDVYLCSYNRIFPNGENKVFNRFERLEVEKIVSGQNLLSLMYERKFYESSVWANIYSREFLLSNNLLFDMVLIRYEDEAWFLKVMLLAKKVKILDLLIYNNRAGRTNSLSNSLNYKHCIAKIDLSDLILSYCEGISIVDRNLLRQIKLGITSFYLHGILESHQFNSNERNEILTKAKQKKYIIKNAVSLKQKISVIILRVFGFKCVGYILSKLKGVKI